MAASDEPDSPQLAIRSEIPDDETHRRPSVAPSDAPRPPPLALRFEIPDGETYPRLSAATMSGQIVANLKAMHAHRTSEFIVECAMPAAVSRQLASHSPPLSEFFVKTAGCNSPVCVEYPFVDQNHSATEWSINRHTNQAVESKQGDGVRRGMILFWISMNPRISVLDVQDSIDAIAGDDPTRRVKDFYTCIIKPTDSEFLNDRNAISVLAGVSRFADEMVAIAKREKADTIGIISGLPTALTMQMGLRLKPQLVYPCRVCDFFRSIDAGYVAVPDFWDDVGAA